MIKRLRIQHKLLLTYALSTLMVFVIAGGIWVYINHSQHKAYFNDRLKSQGQLVSNNITAAVLFEDLESATEIASALGTDPAIISAKVISPTGQTLVDMNFQEAKSTAKQAGQYNLDVPIKDDEQVIATLSILFHDREVSLATWQSATSIMALMVFALLVGTTFANRFLSLVTVPIHRLSRLAREITSSKNYSLRCERYHPDEVGDLAEDFNAMLDIVEKRELDLEGMVKSRTEQLEKKNSELEFQIAEREKSESARREIEARFEQAFLNAPIGMGLVDADQQIFRYNEMLNRLISIEPDKTLKLQDFIYEKHTEEISGLFTRLVEGNEVSFEAEVQYSGHLDTRLTATFGISAVRDDKARFLYGVLQLQDVTESRKLSAELQHQAQHDDLTGLQNRRALNQALHAAFNEGDYQGMQHTLCILDLDQFKVVNDTCGHSAGDELLRQVANLIRQKVRANDLVVRLGGDEFALLLYHCDKDKAHQITEIIRAAIEKLEFFWEDQVFRIGVSIGAVAVTQSSVDISTLLQKADSACYTAKDSGRNRVYIITGEEDPEITEREGQMRWVQRLHTAMEKDDFLLYGQKIVPTRVGENEERLEILLRLRNRKDGSIILPRMFLPAAERYGLNTKVDRWVVNHLMRNLPHHRKTLGDNYSYWVNLSGISLSDDHFIEFLEQSISAAKLPAGTINFEITETAVVRNITDVAVTMSRLKALGCRFALDDFGTGISSFGYLKHLPVDYIKIDGLFVRDILTDDVNLVFIKSIIDIARTMNIKTVAEFVESDEIFDKVRELGADYAQGIALGRPELLTPLHKNAPDTIGS